MKNVLVLNAGTRNKLLQYFKNTLDGRAKLIATDNYFLAPAIYEADVSIVTKRWDEPGYWEQVLDICKENNVGLIVSLIDPELEMLAHYKIELEKLGIVVNIADEDRVHACMDKYEMMQFLKEHHYPTIQSYVDYREAIEKIEAGVLHLPVFVKPRCGSGSAGIEKISTLERLKEVGMQNDNIIIQEFVEGQEYGVDVFVDLISKQVISIFAKKKLKMRAGETDKSVSCKNAELFAMIERFTREFGLQGANDIDVFERDGQFYISEVNPRFGGGYLHAYECGQDFPAFLFNNMNGVENQPQIGDYKENVYMMKYFDVKMWKV